VPGGKEKGLDLAIVKMEKSFAQARNLRSEAETDGKGKKVQLPQVKRGHTSFGGEDKKIVQIEAEKKTPVKR